MAEPLTDPSQFLYIEDTGQSSQAQACANTLNDQHRHVLRKP